MIEIKNQVQDKIKAVFKEKLIFEIYEFLRESKEKLREVDIIEQQKATSEDIEEENVEEYDSYFEEEDMRDEDMDDFIEYDDDNRVNLKKIMTKDNDVYEENDNLDLIKYKKRLIPGEKEEFANPLKALIDIFSDIFFSIKYLKNEAMVLNQITSKITEKGKGISP